MYCFPSGIRGVAFGNFDFGTVGGFGEIFI